MLGSFKDRRRLWICFFFQLRKIYNTFYGNVSQWNILSAVSKHSKKRVKHFSLQNLVILNRKMLKYSRKLE